MKNIGILIMATATLIAGMVIGLTLSSCNNTQLHNSPKNVITDYEIEGIIYVNDGYYKYTIYAGVYSSVLLNKEKMTDLERTIEKNKKIN